MKDFVLITGVTGFLGRFLLHELSQHTSVAVLVRPTARQSAEERVAAICRFWESRTGIRPATPRVLVGDVAKPMLGLSEEDLDLMQKSCWGIVHCAASVEFSQLKSSLTVATNCAGTSHVLDLMDAADIAHLYYVSTAYVCGRRMGTIYESNLEHDAGFKNPYEESKLQAETLVRIRCPDATILRPSIITGASSDGFSSNFSSGPYTVMKFTWMMSQHAEKDADGYWEHPVQLPTDIEASSNWVPVDWVASTTAQIVSGRRLDGETYHLTHPQPVSMATIEKSLRDYFKYRGVCFSNPDADIVGQTRLDGGVAVVSRKQTQSRSQNQIAFDEAMREYLEYFSSCPTFDRSNLESFSQDAAPPAYDDSMLHRLIDYAVANRFRAGK